MEVPPKTAASLVVVEEVMSPFIFSNVRHIDNYKRRCVPKATSVFVTPKTSNPMASEWGSLSVGATLRA
jgi:hypothetical protein